MCVWLRAVLVQCTCSLYVCLWPHERAQACNATLLAVYMCVCDRMPPYLQFICVCDPMNEHTRAMPPFCGDAVSGSNTLVLSSFCGDATWSITLVVMRFLEHYICAEQFLW